jgi:hypothetical protein
MFSAYLDESFDNGNEGIFAVGAVFGDGWDRLRAESLWKEALGRNRLRAFKWNRQRRKPDVLAQFTRALSDSGMVACGIVTSQQQALEMMKGSALSKLYRQSPLMLMYQQCFVNIAMDLREGKSPRHVTFICDRNARYEDIMISAYAQLREQNPLSRPYLGRLHLEADEDCIPLQMADLVAGELRAHGTKWLDPQIPLSPTLTQLTEARVFWKINHMDESSLSFVRTLVDERAAQVES